LTQYVRDGIMIPI